MDWSPDQGGFWYSPVGRAMGSATDLKDAIRELNNVELRRNGIPSGYRFDVAGQRQYVLFSGSKLPTPPVGKVKRSKKTSNEVSVPAYVPPVSDAPAPQAVTPAPYVPRPAVKGKPVQIPPMPVEKPRMAPTSVPKAVPYVAKPKPAEDAPPAVIKPKPTSGPQLIADEPPATPVALPAPKPAIPDAPAAPGGMINGIPPAMQKSFLSRNKSVFMIFDKDKGQWTSSPGAVKDLEAADEWCKQATTVDRSYGRIPDGFSYHHMGSGQVQIRKD